MTTNATETQSPEVENFALMFEESLQRQEMRAGEVITAEVTRIDHNFVVVNAGLKSESYISIDEFKNDQGEVEATVGDYVSVAIDIYSEHGTSIIRRRSYLSLREVLAAVILIPGDRIV